jgi:ribosomal protein S18 acetylase RimI-like enzyme
MFRIRPARAADHDQVVGLLARLQSVPSHHIGFHGETEIELVDELAGLCWPSATVVAVDATNRVRGVLSVAVDGGRAWWYGPFVDVPAEHPAADRIWARTADALYAAGRALPIARRVTDSELYGHVAHCRLAAFARRHGFPPGEYSSLLVLDGVDLVRLVGTVPDAPGVEIAELDRPVADSRLAAALVRLHEKSFPATYLSAAGLLDGERTVVVATHAGRLAGYATGAAQPADYFLDHVAVGEDFRCRGVGTALVTTLVQSLAERCGAREAACAVIAGGNAPSRGMFRGLGFEPRLELVSYRLRATSLVA